MKPFSFFRSLLGAALICGTSLAHAETPDSLDSEDAPEAFSIVPHGFAGLQSFRVAGYKNLGVDRGPQTFNNSVLNFTFDLVSGKRLTIRSGIEGYVTFSTVPYDKLGNVGRTEVAAPLWSWYMAQAEIAYSFGEADDNFHGDLGVGLFPYKYNEEARNLGEYLFRSGTYPGWLSTTFDWTATRLTGARFSSTLFNKWHNDVMLTTEMEWFPFYDLSLSWVSDLPVGKVLDLGAGVDFARISPAKEEYTTPQVTEATNNKTVPSYYMKGADTTFYTYSGIKAMARATFDPKAIFGDFNGKKLGTLGKNDGKIFGEVAVLGLQNQGTVYNKVTQRMPMMVGFNLPTFNLLDVVAIQMEYYGSPYPNDYINQIAFVSAGVPIPTKGDGNSVADSKYTVADSASGRPNFYTKDNVKWSIYARRWMGPHLAIVAQAARDHWRTSTPYAQFRDTEEALSTSKHWYMAFKIVSVW
ncbi:MAG: hypothetical protein JWP91_2120 [Fibrobacteres bacterium]|nr:hypothetical protein [Fibrobacterota bacterium]